MINNKFRAYLDDYNLITVLITKINYNKDLKFKLMQEEKEIPIKKIKTEELDNNFKISFFLDSIISLQKQQFLVTENDITELFSGKIVRTKRFYKDYNYNKNDLGVIYSKDKASFKLWSPLAKSVTLELISDSGNKNRYSLNYFKNGVWSLTINKDLAGWKYFYKVYVNGREEKVIDPYAKSSNANGEISYIIDLDNTYKIKNKNNANKCPIIYEVSIRDFTSDKKLPFKNKRKYSGFIEKNLTYKDKPIGLDYLKFLGVTHIQFMPIFDFTGIDELAPEEAYNWGYNPSQFFIPEGSYSEKANDPYKRINEVKEMIDTLHKEGFNVIMDVVYNHVDVYNRFAYEKMVPGYSFRVDNQGLMTAYSGCKNDLATERPMIRKIIIDSLKYWLKEFNLDGFRFDLMGLIDYNTMNEIEMELTNIKSDILLYGEGWKLKDDDNLAYMENKKVNKAFKFFNDEFRDLIKGSTFNKFDKGFALGKLLLKNKVKKVLLGRGKLKPSQSINYIECHDNLTFFDKASFIEEKAQLVKHKQLLATTITILAPGIPFLHAGQEFYRSKNSIEDSYNSGDTVNKISWELVDNNWQDIKFIKSIINIKKTLGKIKNINDLSSGLILIYENYIFIIKVIKEREEVKLNSNYNFKLATSQISNIDNLYILDDIGIYIFERK
ncbi:MAG: type I pullulanase [Bacillota bacterium]